MQTGEVDLDAIQAWLATKQQSETRSPLSDAELLEAFEYTCKYGSGNHWAGTIGHGAGIIRKLLLEIARLKKAQD